MASSSGCTIPANLRDFAKHAFAGSRRAVYLVAAEAERALSVAPVFRRSVLPPIPEIPPCAATLACFF